MSIECMVECKSILNKLNIPILIWKREGDVMRCMFRNDKALDVKEGMELEEYLKGQDTAYRNIYEEIMDSESALTLKIDDKDIIINRINDTTICETRYERCTDLYLLSTINHKLKIPLTNMIGSLSVLEDMRFNDEQKVAIDKMKGSCYNIVGIFNDIIDILNLETGNTVLKKNKIDLIGMVKRCFRIVRHSADDKNLDIRVNIENDIPKFIIGDERRIEQILLNLLENAIDNTEMGGIRLDISKAKPHDMGTHKYTEPSKSQTNLLFKLRDTGNGMNDVTINMMEEILDIRSDHTCATHKYKINGFGMIISRELCALMGGHIWFRTTRDMGTTFYFNIIVDC